MGASLVGGRWNSPGLSVLCASRRAGWDHADLRAARGFGDAWIRERRTVVLVAPSVVAGREGNVLINPRHRDFSDIVACTPEPVVWDAWSFAPRDFRRRQHAAAAIRAGLNAYPQLALAVDSDDAELPGLKAKRIFPHTLRRTTALRLLQSSVPFSVIAQWLELGARQPRPCAPRLRVRRA